jgi:translation elongation factor EF-Tu-like GTPase
MDISYDAYATVSRGSAIEGVACADVAILCVPATPNEYETAMGPSGQTIEHAVILRGLGVEQVDTIYLCYKRALIEILFACAGASVRE